MRLRLFAPALLAAIASMACVNIPGLNEGDGGAAAASSSSDAGAHADGASSVTGTGCTGDLGGGVVLCTGTTECPSVAVDHDKHPSCGFRIRGTAIDIECVCDNQLCPLGVPTTCQQAADLLATQSEIQVCGQINEGRCVPLASSGGATSAGSCDKTCAGECGGDPSCIKICGC